MTPGDYALAERAVADLRRALASMLWPSERGPVSVLAAHEQALATILAEVRHHREACVVEMEAAMPTRMIVFPDGDGFPVIVAEDEWP